MTDCVGRILEVSDEIQNLEHFRSIIVVGLMSRWTMPLRWA